ncbi:MAG: glycosyltransferase family protein [Acidimicrobiales bacterium]
MPKTLVLSFRNLHRSPAFSALYEFEDLAVELLGADLVTVRRSIKDRRVSLSRTAYQVGRSLGVGERVADRMALAPGRLPVRQDYDLVICVLTNFYDLYPLHQVGDWDRWDVPRVCFVSEPWPSNLRLRSARLEPLRGFTRWYSGLECGVAPLREMTRSDVDYLPLAVDTDRFRGDPASPRPIRYLNIGRRNADAHARLLAESEDSWYWFDSLSGGLVDTPAEHRDSLARLYRRASFSITNVAKFDQSQVTGGRREVPGRFFEALAAGAVLLGTAPRSGLPGAELIVEAGEDGHEYASIVAGLEQDEQGLVDRRRRGIELAARHHDWSDRIGRILDDLDLARPAALQERLSRLAGA